MRVIGGTFKGRRLEAPAWEGLRPTSDKLRETLFNILAPRIEGARVLDGFAGTGAIGIEALSRGAAEVTFIDADRRALALIARNLALCGLDPGSMAQPAGATIRVLRGDVRDILRDSPPDRVFDLIVLDPPYDAAGVRDALDAAAARLAPDGLLVLERATRREPDIPASLTRMRDVKSGDSSLTFLLRADQRPETGGERPAN